MKKFLANNSNNNNDNNNNGDDDNKRDDVRDKERNEEKEAVARETEVDRQRKEESDIYRVCVCVFV